MGQKMWYHVNFGVRPHVILLICISCWLLGSQIEKQPVTCVATAATAQSRLQCLHECPSPDMATRRVAFGGKSSWLLPPGALMDLTQTNRKKSSILKLKSRWCLFFWGNLRNLKSSRWGLLKENIWGTFQVIRWLCDMLKLWGCDQFWSYDQCLCRKEAMDEGQRFDGSLEGIFKWGVSTFNEWVMYRTW